MNNKFEQKYLSLIELIKEYLSDEDQSYIQAIIDRKITNDSKVSSDFMHEIEQYTVEDQRLVAFRRFQIETIITELKPRMEKNLYFDMLLNMGKTAAGLGENSFSEALLIQVLDSTNDDSFLKEVKAYTLIELGKLYSNQAKWSSSINLLHEAMSILKESTDISGLAKCQNMLGAIYGDQGDFSKAKECFNEALDYLESSNNNLLKTYIQENLAITNLVFRNFDEAIPGFLRALKYYESINATRSISNLRYNLGIAYLYQGQLKAAKREIELSIEEARKAEYLPQFTLAYLGKSSIYLEEEDYKLSMAFADKSEELSYKVNDRLTIADIYKIKGIIYSRIGDNNLAENQFLTSLRLNKELNNSHNYAETSYELGLLYKKQNKKDDANRYLKSAIDYNRKIGADNIAKEIEIHIVH